MALGLQKQRCANLVHDLSLPLHHLHTRSECPRGVRETVRSFQELWCHNSIWMLHYWIQIRMCVCPQTCICGCGCVPVGGGAAYTQVCGLAYAYAHAWGTCVSVWVHLMGLGRDPSKKTTSPFWQQIPESHEKQLKEKKRKPMNVHFLWGPLLSFQDWANSPSNGDIMWLCLCENILADLSLLRISLISHHFLLLGS